jgi:exonuclease III
MDTNLKYLLDIIIKDIALIGVYIAAINYRSQRIIKRGEWLKALFEKFYENENYKEVRKWIESGDINKKINIEDNVVTNEEEKFTDYLNFFEFIATLEIDGHLKLKDVLNLFDYYLRMLKTLPVCMNWIERKYYGFEKLRTLLKKIK